MHAHSDDDADDNEVEDMSYRDRLSRAQELQAGAGRAAAQGELAAAAAGLTEALRFLRDVDEDSPKEAQQLRAAVLEASRQVFAQGATRTLPGVAETAAPDEGSVVSPAQTAHLLCQAAAEDAAPAPTLLRHLLRDLAEREGARDFCDAGGLPPLLQLCARQDTACASQALEAVQALSGTGSMVPAICMAGAQCGHGRPCLWWLRQSFCTGARAPQRMSGLRILRNLSDTKGLDDTQQAAVSAILRSAITSRHPDTPGDGEATQDMIAQLHALLAAAMHALREPDYEQALLLCTCFRNLARDAGLRGHFAPVLPELLHVCFRLASSRSLDSPDTARGDGAGTATCKTDKGSKESESGDPPDSPTPDRQGLLLAALEALINCMSNSSENRAAVLDASHAITCRFTHSKWGFGLKTLQPPLILTRVDGESEAARNALMAGDIVVRVGEHLDHGHGLPLLQQALRQGGAAEVQLQRTGVGILAGNVDE